MKPSRCIICLKNDPPGGFSEEHIFPQALGGTLTTKTVCKPCNDRLGHSVDGHLVNHTLIALARQHLGLAGKRGKVPNPLERATMHGDPEYHLKIPTWDEQSTLLEPRKLYTVRKVTRIVLDDGQPGLHVRLDADDIDELGDVVNKALIRAGGAPLSDDEIAHLKTQVTRVDNVTLNMRLSLDASHYRRGLMKIAYELACLWLGDQYLDDPIAKVLRDCMLDASMPLDISSKYRIRGNIATLAAEPIMPFWKDEPDSLIGAGLRPRGSGDISVYVRVLGVFDALLVVTENAGVYSNFAQHFVCTDARTGLTRQSNLAEEIERMCVVGDGLDRLL